MKRVFIPVLSASLVSASVASASTDPPTALRDSAPLEGASDIGSSLALIGAIVVAVGVLFFVILDDDDDESPASP